ncbi:hypothetical protein [Paenibacillus sp. NEAU-GSW1]|uniref:hypothetical protein n=1 Tax=Paenibacillus sp. NEAU-GSW1 TaxID=2682486 RepID=UPI0012E25C7C|nr:hypothetical protein [Paenibacillus sp. NEAU-GSW1]MUT64625.1 hypothetical protein [Paenibacillus sp. NEAU-GSW1]
MKLHYILFAIALCLGLIVPYLYLLLKITCVGAAYMMDAAVAEKTEKRRYPVMIFFFIGVIASYLYKLL